MLCICCVDALLVRCWCFAMPFADAARFAGSAVPVMLAVSISKGVRTAFRLD